jgi:hypothetical protein
MGGTYNVGWVQRSCVIMMCTCISLHAFVLPGALFARVPLADLVGYVERTALTALRRNISI